MDRKKRVTGDRASNPSGRGVGWHREREQDHRIAVSHDDFSRDVLASSPDTCPGQISWDYDRAEIIADGVVHAIGVCLGLIGVTIIAPILVYVIGLVTMLALSAAYNMWPGLPVKWVLRRFDHSAIYLLIAGTYTPFLAQMKNVLASAGLGSRALAYLQLLSRTCR